MERIIEFYLAGWQKYACFEGRACRAEIWAFTLINNLIMMLISTPLYFSIMSSALNPSGSSASNGGFGILFPIILIFGLILFIPYISITVRRLHDLNQSGWIYLAVILVSIIPFIGGIISIICNIIIYCAKGTEGSNQYGSVSDLYY